MAPIQPGPQRHMDCSPLRKSYYGIAGDQRLKLTRVCLLSLANLPCCWTPGTVGIRGSEGAQQSCLLSRQRPVLLTSVHDVIAAPELLAVLADLQGSTVGFSIITSSLVKEHGQPCEPRGETKKKTRSWVLMKKQNEYTQSKFRKRH